MEIIQILLYAYEVEDTRPRTGSHSSEVAAGEEWNTKHFLTVGNPNQKPVFTARRKRALPSLITSHLASSAFCYEQDRQDMNWVPGTKEAWLQKAISESRSLGTFLAVQWSRLHASTAGATGSMPDQGTKIPHITWCSQKKKKKKENRKTTRK